LRSESNNNILLLRLLITILGTSILLHTPSTTWPTRWWRVLDDHRQNI